MRHQPGKLKLESKLIAALLSSAFVFAGLSGCGRTQSTESLLSDAKQYEQKGDLKAALIQLKNAVEKSPDNGEARLALGNLELDMGDAASAEPAGLVREVAGAVVAEPLDRARAPARVRLVEPDPAINAA